MNTTHSFGGQVGSFGGTSFGAAPQLNPTGTTIRFVPVVGADTFANKSVPGGPTQHITVRHHHICLMKDYANKSIDELRLEDYQANRKIGTIPNTLGAPFNNMQPSTSAQSTSVFGANTSGTTNLFGQQTQPQNPTMFGNNNMFANLNKPNTTVTTSPFGVTNNQFAPSTSATNFSMFPNNNTNTNTSLFNTSTVNSPFKTNTFASPLTNTGSLFNTNANTSNNTSGFLNTTQTNTTPQAQPFGGGSSVFGATTNNQNAFGTTNLFGNQPKTGFDLNNSAAANANKPAFQLPGTNSLFNFGASSSGNTMGTNTNTTTTSLFGPISTSVANPTFGVTNNTFNANPAPTNNQSCFTMFPNNTNTNTNTNANTNTSLFNTSTVNSPFKTNTFASPLTNTGSLFNTNANTSNNTSGFLNTAQPAAPQAQPFGGGTSIFGTPNNNQNAFGTTNLFGNQPKTGFDLNNSATANANKPAFQLPGNNSLFNFAASSGTGTATTTTNTTTTSLFGPLSTTTATNNTGLFSNLNNTSNIFSNQQPNTTSLFSTNTLTNNQASPFQLQSQPVPPPVQQTSPQSPDLLLNRLKTLPYGDTSLFINDTGSSSTLGSLKFTTDPKTINQYKMNAKTNVKLNKPESTEKNRTSSVLFDGLDDNGGEDLRCAIDVFVPKKNIKQLDVQAETSAEPHAERSILASRPGRDSWADGRRSNSRRHVRYADDTFPGDHSGVGDSFVSSLHTSSANLTKDADSSSLRDFLSRSGSTNNNSHTNMSSTPDRNFSNYKSGFINTRSEYKIRPTLQEIECRYNPETDSCIVDSLLIERPNYGSILFESPLDVKDVNLDDIVHIRRKEVVVYPDDENKPPVGQGLNRPAIITLHQVWPVDKSNNEVIKDLDRLTKMRYPEKIESITVDKGARFIEYRSETGSWVFGVKHFSKYGITDDDEDIASQVDLPSSQSMPPPPAPLSHTHSSTTHSTTGNGMHANRISRSPAFLDTMVGNSSYINTSPLERTPAPRTPAPFKTAAQESGSVGQFKMSAKINIKLNKASSPDEHKNNSVLYDSVDDLANYSIRPAIDELFDTEEDFDSRRGELKRSFTVHGTKRLALQNISPNVSSVSYDKPIMTGAVVPRQQRVRDIKLKLDLYSAHAKLSRDIMSVCVSGAPRVRFFNGSRKFCIINGDNVQIQELKLVPTAPSGGALADDIKERFESFFESHSLVTQLNMNPTLGPYVETFDFIPNASSHDLLHALYGNLSCKTPYAKQDERLNRVINWLASVNRNIPEPTNLYRQIIHHMSCDRYDLASALAVENSHPRLALLVGALNLNKDLIFEQLSSWKLSAADQYIDPELMKIYILLAGLTEWKLSNDVTMYCLKGLKWTQQLCLLFLHVTSFVTEPDKYGFHMLPLYVKRLDTSTDDVDYHILARHSPAQILSAAENLVDEWFLLESLKSFHVINSESECMNSDIIHCNLASQLAAIDLRWACFVASHIISNESRNQVLLKCLEQNHNQFKEEKQDRVASVSKTTVESWLVEKLKIPAEFIENAKALASQMG